MSKNLLLSVLLLASGSTSLAGDLYAPTPSPIISIGGIITPDPATELPLMPKLQDENPFIPIGPGGRMPIFYPIGGLLPKPVPVPPEPGKP